MTDDALFEMEPELELAGSADRRRTAKIAAGIAAGRHPLSWPIVGVLMHPEAGLDGRPGAPAAGPSCGGCAHRRPGRYAKCDAFGRAGLTHSAATDVRAWWPGCAAFEEYPGTV